MSVHFVLSNQCVVFFYWSCGRIELSVHHVARRVHVGANVFGSAYFLVDLHGNSST